MVGIHQENRVSYQRSRLTSMIEPIPANTDREKQSFIEALSCWRKSDGPSRAIDVIETARAERPAVKVEPFPYQPLHTVFHFVPDLNTCQRVT